jgi:hypothetical protein
MLAHTRVIPVRLVSDSEYIYQVNPRAGLGLVNMGLVI